MAGRSAVLAIKILADAKGASAGFADAESRMDKFERGMGRASVAASGVIAGLVAIGKEAFDAASALEQSAGAVETVFGGQADAVKALAADAAQAVGLSTNQYQELAALMGSQLKVGGIDESAIVPTMDLLMARGADLAATFGGDATTAVEALSSALKGERDPIEAYGISLTQAAVDSKVAAMGLDTSTDAAKKQSETLATLQLILGQSAAAQGAFGREADTAAGQQQRANAEWENAQATLGEVLLPIVAAASQKVAEFSQWLVANRDTVIPLIAVLGGLAVAVIAINTAMSIYKAGLIAWRAVQVTVTAAQWLWNAAMAANPIGIIVLAIAALVAGVILAYNKFGWFRDLVNTLGDVFSSVFGWIMDVIQPVVDVISWIADKLSWIGDAASWVGDLFSSSGVEVQVAGSAGMMGAAAGMRGAPLIAGAAGAGVGPGSGGAGAGGPGMVVNVTVNGAIDPVGTGRQIEKVLREYGRATGRQLTLTAGRTA